MKRFALLAVCVAMVLSAATATAQERRVQLRFQGGVEVGVPIFLNVDRDIVKAGGSLMGWAGFDIGWFVVEFGLGWQWHRINTDAIPTVTNPAGSEPLVRLHFSPGVRFQIPTIDAVLPYITGAFDANIWSFAALANECGWYYCRDNSRGQFAPGFTGKGGLGIRLKGSIYLDVGFQYSMSGRGNFFEQQRWWVEPYIGFIYRGDTDRFGGTGY